MRANDAVSMVDSENARRNDESEFSEAEATKYLFVPFFAFPVC